MLWCFLMLIVKLMLDGKQSKKNIEALNEMIDYLG